MGVNLRAALFAAGLVFAFTANGAWALPSFARDSKVSCFSCHYKSAAQYISATQISGKEQALVTFSTKEKMRAGILLHGSPVKPPGQAKLGQMFYPGNDNRAEARSQVTGLSGYLTGEYFQASFGWLNPKASVMFLDDDSSNGAEMWYRLALTPNAGGLNFTIGLFGAGGRMGDKQDGGASHMDGVDYFSIPLKTSAVGIDAGVSGAVAGVSLKLKTVYMSGQGLDLNGHGSAYQAPQGDAPSQFSAKAQVGISADFGLSASYSTYIPGDGGQAPDNAVNAPEKSATIGAWLKINDKINIMPEYTIYGPDKQWLDKGTGEFYLRFFTGF
ncbi:MAG: hypothetical protein OEZ04_08095 [Nitrospinota bacterium]|nr:hypothetical protein [Nitrospinota bacterium]